MTGQHPVECDVTVLLKHNNIKQQTLYNRFQDMTTVRQAKPIFQSLWQVLDFKNLGHFFIQNLLRLAHMFCLFHFCYMSFTGSLDCPYPLWLAGMITKGFLLQHSIENCSTSNIMQWNTSKLLVMFINNEKRKHLKVALLKFEVLTFAMNTVFSWVSNMQIGLQNKEQQRNDTKS